MKHIFPGEVENESGTVRSLNAYVRGYQDGFRDGFVEHEDIVEQDDLEARKARAQSLVNAALVMLIFGVAFILVSVLGISAI